MILKVFSNINVCDYVLRSLSLVFYAQLVLLHASCSISLSKYLVFCGSYSMDGILEGT